MKRIAVLVFSALLSFASYAQPESPQETARNFMKVGDWDNAILVLNRALQSDPNNLELSKDLAFSYLYDKNYSKALENVNHAIENDQDAYYMYMMKARIQKELGDKSGAKASAEKCVQLATADKNDDYIRQGNDFLKTL